jgi:DNA-binding XRE family transcriptional regulator
MSTGDDELVTDSEELTNHDPEMDHFLREWREYRELTQPKLAEMIGAQKSQISHWETKARPLTSISWVRKICKALDIETPDLYQMPPSLMEGSSERSQMVPTADSAVDTTEGAEGLEMFNDRVDLIDDIAELPDELIPTARKLLTRLKALGAAAGINPTKRARTK